MRNPFRRPGPLEQLAAAIRRAEQAGVIRATPDPDGRMATVRDETGRVIAHARRMRLTKLDADGQPIPGIEPTVIDYAPSGRLHSAEDAAARTGPLPRLEIRHHPDGTIEALAHTNSGMPADLKDQGYHLAIDDTAVLPPIPPAPIDPVDADRLRDRDRALNQLSRSLDIPRHLLDATPSRNARPHKLAPWPDPHHQPEAEQPTTHADAHHHRHTLNDRAEDT
jgi:hypothetical protein